MLLLLLGTWTSLVFASFPDEYPLYLRTIGFEKDEIRDLRDGGVVTHGIRDALPGEFGVVAARVINVPPYYFRDYYLAVENFKTLRNFQNIGAFQTKPTAKDLQPLELTNPEISALVKCKSGPCDFRLSPAEIANLPSGVSDQYHLSDVYRSFLANRLLEYKKSGSRDAASVAEINRFSDLAEYFHASELYLLNYPSTKNENGRDLFYWARENLGRQSAITLHHLFAQPVGEDFIMIDREIYNSRPGIAASITVLHLIGYADRTAPATLVVLQQRVQTDLTAMPFQVFVKNYYRISLREHLLSELKNGGKAIEERYQGRAFATFPFGLRSRDQR